MGSKKVNAYYNGGMTSGDGNSFNSPDTMNSRKIIDGFAKNNGLMGMGNGGGMSDVTDVYKMGGACSSKKLPNKRRK
tara:strand:+ start:350 stop:580 length:231 start_codon:yes stop_codon:yes gene_type:complete